MTAYTRQIEQARRVIRAKGEACRWLSQATARDPAKPWIENGDAPIETPVSILFTLAKRQYQEAFRALMSSEVVGGKYDALMANTPGLAPTAKDRIRRSDGSVVSIASIDPLAPDGTPIIYMIQFSR